MHPSVKVILVLLVGWMLVRVVRRTLGAMVSLRVIEAATTCSCGYSMAGIPFGTCPECGRPHVAMAPRPLGRPRLILALLLVGLAFCMILGTWGSYVALGAIMPPEELSRQSLQLNSTAGDIRFDWTIEDPRTDPQVQSVRVTVVESAMLPKIKPIFDTITAGDMAPPKQTPDAPARVDSVLASILDGAGELAAADRAALTADLRWIIEGALRGSASNVLVPTAARAKLYWGSGSGGFLRIAPRVDAWPFLPLGLLAWTGGAFVIVRRWEHRVKA